jgi:hypothetical protein
MNKHDLVTSIVCVIGVLSVSMSFWIGPLEEVYNDPLGYICYTTAILSYIYILIYLEPPG